MRIRICVRNMQPIEKNRRRGHPQTSTISTAEDLQLADLLPKSPSKTWANTSSLPLVLISSAGVAHSQKRFLIEEGHEVSSTPWKRILTSSASNAALNAGSLETVRFTAPSNSHSIRTASFAIHRRSSSVSPIKSSVDRTVARERMRSIRMEDKHGEVACLIVERAMGIQRRPPCVQAGLRVTTRSFGSLEKSRDRSNSPPSV